MPAERLYYADSALTDFTATVTDIRERSRSGGTSVWQVALDRTAFYPTSGGQPNDTGTLAATAPSGARLEAPVVEVEEDEHGEVWHLTPKPLLAGTQIEGRIDRERRTDHMQQHSGQHLLSALFYRELRALTISFHLGDTVSTIDLNKESIEPAQLAHIERLANDIIAEARPCHPAHRFGRGRRPAASGWNAAQTSDALRGYPPRRYCWTNCRGRCLRRRRRTVQANDPWRRCSESRPRRQRLRRHSRRLHQPDRRGTHPRHRAYPPVHPISFLCGNRAIAAARADDTLLTQLSRELSAPRADLPSAITRLKSEARAAAKERQNQREELANYHAARLLVEDPPQNDLRIVRRIFPDRDADYIKLLASRVTSAAAHTVALLASTRQPGQQREEPATLVVACSPEPGHNAGELLRSALATSGGRGGGSATLAQGLVPPDQLPAILDALEAKLRPAT